MLSSASNQIDQSAQVLKRDLLLAMEANLATKVDKDLMHRARELADREIHALIDEYMRSKSVSKFRQIIDRLSRHIPALQNSPPNVVDELIRNYLESQIHFAQCVKLEMDVISLSQYLRKHFGPEQAIELLKFIDKPDFDLSDYIRKNTIAKTPNKFADMQVIMQRLQHFYLHADIKHEYYQQNKKEQETGYQLLQESLLWVNGQRNACITGIREIQNNTVHTRQMTKQTSERKVSTIEAARAHTEMTIGGDVAELLLLLENDLIDMPVADVLTCIKKADFFKSFIRALGNSTCAGYKTYLPNASVDDVLRLVDEFLTINIYLAQPLLYEMNVLRISQYLRQEYNSGISMRLLTEIEQLDFDARAFFAGMQIPKAEILAMIENIHRFYLYANIKKQDGFFDPEEAQAKKLFESEMWISLQRYYCIQGMALIQSKAAHHDVQINFNEKEAVPVNLVAGQPSELKKPKLIRKDSLERMPKPVAHYDWSQFQGRYSEEEALQRAMHQSEMDAREQLANEREQRELEAAVERSRIEARHEPVADSVLLADALTLIELLRAVALRRVNQNDDADMPDWGTSDAEEERYRLNHQAIVRLEETNLSEMRFRAASQFLSVCMGVLRTDVNGNTDRDAPLEIQLNRWLREISITASHNVHVVMKHYHNRDDIFSHDMRRRLPAPIALFPFDKLKNAMLDHLVTCFSGWQVSQTEPERLWKTISCENYARYNIVACAFYYLQDACRELIKDFNLDIKMDDDHIRERKQFIVSVRKDSLEQAKGLVGYRSSLQNGLLPSLAEMLQANRSPIITHRGMVRSASMERLRFIK